MNEYIDSALENNSWPFIEARALLKRYNPAVSEGKGYVLFQTGYGPSGLPHIGTFAEVVRTIMVKNAFNQIAPDIETRLFAFSDDMDGLRHVPENIPNKEMVQEHIGKPLTSIPDPFGSHESFGAHNNARLKSFLDSFGFEYEFISSTECYKSGLFDGALIQILENYDKVINVVLPTLGPERRITYSPFLPICSLSGKVLQVPIVNRDIKAGTITYEGDRGRSVEVSVTGGKCKLQWKCDWAMRWLAFKVDYEMSGKDLIDSVKLSGKICRALGGIAPQNLTYELFLDERGQKISKSKGNGISVDQWLKYAPVESLAYFMYHKPTAAKRLYFDTIPKSVDEYLSHLNTFPDQLLSEKMKNPVWHIHNGQPPSEKLGVNFSLLLNLVNVCHSSDPKIIWDYISRYSPGSSAENSPILDRLVLYAIVFYQDFVLPKKEYRMLDVSEILAFQELKLALAEKTTIQSSEELQTIVYDIGKAHSTIFPSLRQWFLALYQVLLGQDQGPRMGSFISLYGIPGTITLIEKALANAGASTNGTK